MANFAPANRDAPMNIPKLGCNAVHYVSSFDNILVVLAVFTTSIFNKI